MMISTLPQKIQYCKSQATVILPVVFIVIGLVMNLFLARSNYRPVFTVLGGPPLEANNALALVANAASADVFGGTIDLDNGESSMLLMGSDAILDPANPLNTVITGRDNTLIYRVQSGDTLSHIAATFGISLNTLYEANSGLRGGVLKPGQEILILPISGVTHTRSFGETIDSIASLYGVSVAKIIEANLNLSSDTLIIPGAQRSRNTLALLGNQANLDGYFMIPTKGWNWGRLHYNNGVDIANACGTSVFASAEGIIDRVGTGYDSGYGRNIIIEHPNGTKTRYAHLDRVDRSVGDYILQGDVIGTIGNTGNTHGPTGCHLHFEVRGAKNPFAR